MIYTSSRRPQDQTRGNTPGPSPSTLPAMGAKAFTASPPFPTKPKATSRSRPVRKALASHGSIAWDILIYFTGLPPSTIGGLIWFNGISWG